MAAGDATQLWVTEFGLDLGDGNWHVSDTQKARSVVEGFEALSSVPWVKAASVYNLRDKAADTGSFESNFGLVNRDFSPRAGL